jgi:hypothetical protein
MRTLGVSPKNRSHCRPGIGAASEKCRPATGATKSREPTIAAVQRLLSTSAHGRISIAQIMKVGDSTLSSSPERFSSRKLLKAARHTRAGTIKAQLDQRPGHDLPHEGLEEFFWNGLATRSAECRGRSRVNRIHQLRDRRGLLREREPWSRGSKASMPSSQLEFGARGTLIHPRPSPGSMCHDGDYRRRREEGEEACCASTMSLGRAARHGHGSGYVACE